MVQEELGGLGLTRTALTTDDHRLVLPLVEHRVVRVVRHCENVGGKSPQGLLLVHAGVLGVIDGIEVVRVDGDEDRSHVGIDIFVAEPRP